MEKSVKIPIVERLPPDIQIQRGPMTGEAKYYKMALLNTLIHLHPCMCLEIGTWHGGSSRIFEQYFEEHCPDGFLVTADINVYTRLVGPRVKQVRAYPHMLEILDYHKKLSGSDFLPDWEKMVDHSVEVNSFIVLQALWASQRTQLFDFAFIDGDHQSLLKDIEIVERVVKSPWYALLDDTTSRAWKCSEDYYNEIKPLWESYDFDDWDVFAGCSLIWKN